MRDDDETRYENLEDDEMVRSMKQEPETSPDDAPLEPGVKRSVAVLAFVGLVDAIEYGIVMPSLSK